MLEKLFLGLLLAGLSLVPCALGNGGGYNSPEGGGEGNVLPFELEGVSQVAMEEEDLVIELWNTYADIHVKYKLRNTTNAPSPSVSASQLKLKQIRTYNIFLPSPTHRNAPRTILS